MKRLRVQRRVRRTKGSGTLDKLSAAVLSASKGSGRSAASRTPRSCYVAGYFAE